VNDRPTIDPARAHPMAREVLTDAFFWDAADEGAPLGTDTGAEVLAFVRQRRAEQPAVGSGQLLADLLARWEVADADWDAVEAPRVAEVGAEDEDSLLLRDEIVLALAFAELIETGTIEPEVQRRARMATLRQALPMLLAPWEGRALERAQRLERMSQVLARSFG
jgi:uncharacterized protein YfeS